MDPRSREPWTALERVFALVRPVGRSAERLAIIALLGGVAIWWAVQRAGANGVVLIVLAVVLALPPLALGAFAIGVRALAALPRRLREAPDALRERVELIRRRAGDVTAGQSRGAFGRIRATFRLWWTVASSREVLEVLGPATFLITPATVVAAGIGAIAGVLEILAGLVALVWLAVA